MRIIYHAGRQDIGWAYRPGDVWSEPFATRREALRAARVVAQRQQVEGRNSRINYETADGIWHEEFVEAGDRPEVIVGDERLTAKRLAERRIRSLLKHQ